MPRALQTIHHIPLPVAPSRPFVIAVSALALSLAVFGFSYLSQPLALQAGPAMQARGAGPVPAATSSGSFSQLREMNVANDGLVYIENARVDSVSGSVITAHIDWGSQNFSWAVVAAAGKGGTHFIRQDGSAGTIDDIAPGMDVSITGMLDGSASRPTIDAQYIRS